MTDKPWRCPHGDVRPPRNAYAENVALKAASRGTLTQTECQCQGEVDCPFCALRKLAAERTENARLRAALAPFVARYEAATDTSGLQVRTLGVPDIGDFRRAAEALEVK